MTFKCSLVCLLLCKVTINKQSVLLKMDLILHSTSKKVVFWKLSLQRSWIFRFVVIFQFGWDQRWSIKKCQLQIIHNCTVLAQCSQWKDAGNDGDLRVNKKERTFVSNEESVVKEMVSINRNRWVPLTDGRKVHRIDRDIPPSADREHIFPQDKRHNIQHKIHQHKRCIEIVEVKRKEDRKDEIRICKEYWKLMMNELFM